MCAPSVHKFRIKQTTGGTDEVRRNSSSRSSSARFGHARPWPRRAYPTHSVIRAWRAPSSTSGAALPGFSASPMTERYPRSALEVLLQAAPNSVAPAKMRKSGALSLSFSAAAILALTLRVGSSPAAPKHYFHLARRLNSMPGLRHVHWLGARMWRKRGQHPP
jgi:hypothetical protein